MPSYACIDLKSFYASVECVERGLDPLTTNLVVADPSRTDKTICLAVSPSLKAAGVGGRPRLFEVVQAVAAVNEARRVAAPAHRLVGASADATALATDPSLALNYIVAPPRMALYITYSTIVYEIYLRYVAPTDIHVYSVDEVFIDLTPYLKATARSPEAFIADILAAVHRETGITATAGIGTNLYLAKVAMDIVAKKAPPDARGARMATLTERDYRRKLWSHRPLTDFWRVGRGYARKLEERRLFTMGDIARCSLQNEAMLYRLFGVNAELLIDHAWGVEPCTMADIKAYRPTTHSLSTGQVLTCAYPADKARLVLREMADALSLDLVDKRLVTDRLVLTVGYDKDNLTDPLTRAYYTGAVVTDHYGRAIPRHAHGTTHLSAPTSSTDAILSAVTALFDRIVNTGLTVRRLTLAAAHLQDEHTVCREPPEQLSLFCDPEAQLNARRQRDAARARERSRQEAILRIKKKYGNNAIFRGMDLEDGATARERNRQIGGHNA